MVGFGTHPALEEMIENGKAKGRVTYDELNALLPDEMVEPDQIDKVLFRLEQLGVKMVEGTVEPVRRKPASVMIEDMEEYVPAVVGEEAVAGDAEPADEEEETEEDPEQLRADLVLALQEAQSRRIDDPVRMYLTQMGEISLLTRDEEIRLAKKIETCRMIFRRKVLENDYSVEACVEVLTQVH